jgi:predicted metal-dependent peptidase
VSDKKKDPWGDGPWGNVNPGQEGEAFAIAAARDFMDKRMVNVSFKFAFVGHILMIMRKEISFRVPTISVSANGAVITLHFNPYFVNYFAPRPDDSKAEKNIRQSQFDYILYHEILHVVLHHVTDRRFGNAALSNIAEDLAINSLIPIATKLLYIPMDEEKKQPIGCHVEELQKLPLYHDIEEKRSADYYYDYLIKHPDPDGVYLGSGFDSHDGFGQFEIADEMIRQEIDRINKTNGWGNVGASDRVMIMEAQVRRINWASRILQIMGNHSWRERESTRKRPNRRAGFLQPGSRTLAVDKHLLAVDTSGSVDDKLLSKFLAVINQLSEDMYIDVMQFDWEKTTDPVPYERKVKNFEFKGRGGTNFTPVMEMCKKRGYKSVIILTDGEAAAPEKPPMTRVLWVLPRENDPPVEWGDRVHIKL